MPHIKALERAKIALMTKPDTAFFCEVAFSLKYEWDETIPTACTNGVFMKLNPKFFMKWNKEQQLGLILHESLHVIYMHMVRRGERDARIYNIAGDYVINALILERGFQLPDGGLHDNRFNGMNTEHVYDILIKEAKNPDSHLNSPNQGGIGEDIIEGAVGSGEEILTAKDIEDTIQQTLIRASIRSKEQEDTPGTIPGDIQLFIDRLLKPKLPWNRILQKYLTQYTKSDYTFKRPNRRFFPDHYLPSMCHSTLMDITVAVDISGSVLDEEFKSFVSEIVSIFKMMKPKKITLIHFDTKIQHIDEITSFRDLMNVKFTGRGGTDIGEVIGWANNNKPQLLLFFTDGGFRFKHYDTKRDVLWMIHNNPGFTPKFGKVIHYGID